MQGDFTHWEEGRLVTETFWYDPRIHRTKYVTRKTQIISTNTITEQLESDLWKQKQPDTSLLSNCTVAIIDADPAFYMKWYAVPCHQKISSSILCKYIYKYNRQDVIVVNPHLICEPGWLQLQSKCYAVNKFVGGGDMKAAKQHCTLSNSSLLSLQEKSRYDIDRKHDRYRIQKWEKYLSEYGATGEQRTHYLKILNDIYNRMAVKYDRGLLNILEVLKSKKSMNVRMLAIINNICTVAEYSVRTISGAIEWTAEYCGTKYILADMFICEKPSVIHSNMICKIGYLQCGDQTCILAQYVCDSVNDCLNGEDETMCEPVVMQKQRFSFQNSSLYLPCSLVHNCSYIAQSLVQPVQLHTICDGLKSDLIILKEDELCIKRHVEHINLHQLIVNVYPYGKETYSSFVNELGVLINMTETDKLEMDALHNIRVANQSLIHGDDYNIDCDHSGVTKLADMCKLRSHGQQCALSARSYVCRYVVCPGMFRCGNAYCLPMSSVCDGQVDCLNGFDELACPYKSCPGLLKCRGESRCLSPDQICDGYPDCTLSFDDEIMCSNCPTTHCNCDGYLLFCTVNNTLDTITNIDKLYSKGVILKGLQFFLALNIFDTLSIVYLDVSHCDIAHIKFGSHSILSHQAIIFGNFSVNKILDTTFLGSQLLNKLVVVDLSENYISVFILKGVRLPYLLVIYVKHNPLLVVEIDNNIASLNSVNLEHVKFRWSMSVTVTSVQHYITVTDSHLCCLIPSNITCIIHDEDDQQCYGLMNSRPSGITFICLTILAFILQSCILVKTQHQVFAKNSVRRYFNISKLNNLVAAILSISSLFLLSLLAMLQINVIRWRKSIECHLLNAVFSLTIGINMQFRTFSGVIVAIKIIYPFAHQCQWLKKTYIVCLLTWLCYVLFYTVSETIECYQSIDLVFDKFCSIGDCHLLGLNKRLMYAFICVIDLVLVLIICFLFIWTAVVLKQKNQIKSSRGKLSVLKIMFNLVRQIMPEVIFALCLYSITLVQITTHSLNENYCYAVFSYVLPIVHILNFILSI